MTRQSTIYLKLFSLNKSNLPYSFSVMNNAHFVSLCRTLSTAHVTVKKQRSNRNLVSKKKAGDSCKGQSLRQIAFHLHAVR